MAQYIDGHLGDPGLTIDRIAQALNCSKRHLYNAMADEEETLAAMIQRRRLDACLRDLRHPGEAQRSVTDIALEAGFSDCAHFSRQFKAQHGFTPSDARAQSPGPMARNLAAQRLFD